MQIPPVIKAIKSAPVDYFNYILIMLLYNHLNNVKNTHIIEEYRSKFY